MRLWWIVLVLEWRLGNISEDCHRLLSGYTVDLEELGIFQSWPKRVTDQIVSECRDFGFLFKPDPALLWR